MTCEECAENLSSLVFDELSEELTLSMHEHMADCDSCRESYMELLETQNLLEESLGDRQVISGLSDEHKQKISNAASDEADLAKKTIVFPSWIFAAAACVVIGVIISLNSPKSSSNEMASDYKSEEAVPEEKALSEKTPVLAAPKADALEADMNDSLEKPEGRSRSAKKNSVKEPLQNTLLLEEAKEEKKEVAKAAEKMKKQKSLDQAIEDSAAAPAANCSHLQLVPFHL